MAMTGRLLQLAAAIPLILVAATACSSSSTSASSTSAPASAASSAGSGTSQPASSQSEVTDATQALARNYAGTDGPVPASGPAATANKSIWVITCGQAAAGCATPGNAVMAAAKVIGWSATLCDGKLDPATYAQCVTSATAAKPSAIVLVLVDCEFVQAPLKAAKAAGIKIFGIGSYDCGSTGSTNLFNGQIVFQGGETYQQSSEAVATSIADYIVAKSSGQAHTLLIRENDNLGAKAIGDGIAAELAKCDGCKEYTVVVTVADLTSGNLASKVSAALAQHPDVTAVATTYDAMVTYGVGQAVASAGRPIILTGVEGLAANVALIKSGQQTMDAGIPSQWIGWAGVDELNRLFAGQPEVDEGIGYQTIDADHDLPTTTLFYDGNVNASGKPKQDYQAIYEKSWGR
jgi:ribose transport system substrate-binding protein